MISQRVMLSDANLPGLPAMVEQAMAEQVMNFLLDYPKTVGESSFRELQEMGLMLQRGCMGGYRRAT